MDRLLATNEVAELGPWSEATWAYWRHIGYGPKYARIGKRVVYRESEVRAWLDEQFSADDKDSVA